MTEYGEKIDDQKTNIEILKFKYGTQAEYIFDNVYFPHKADQLVQSLKEPLGAPNRHNAAKLIPKIFEAVDFGGKFHKKSSKIYQSKGR